MPKNVLITGGAGFIGSALCRHLVGVRGWQVTNVDKLTYAANLASLIPNASAPGYRFVQADICDRAHMDAVIAETKPDAILHLAAESHVDRSISASAEFITTNIVGTHTLLEVTRAYWYAGVDLVVLARPQFDLLETAGLAEAICAAKPHLVVNAAAYTAVDKAEDDAETANTVNAVAPGVLAVLAA